MLTPPPINFPPEQYRLIEWLVNRVQEQSNGQASIETNSKYVISQVDGALKRAEVITNALADTRVVAESTAAAFPEIQAELGGVVDNIHRSGRVPAGVIGVTVTANTGHWLDIATPRSSVSFTWTPVTSGIVIDDDAPIDPDNPDSPPVDEIDDSIIVAGYEIWSRRPDQTLTRDAQVLENEATIDTWEPGVQRIVRIRAVSKDGVPGLWSDELSVTPVYPGTLIPKPVTGLAFTQTAEFTPVGPRATVTFTWNAVTQTTDNEPVEIAEYELWADDSAVMRVTDTGAVLVVPSRVSAKVQVAAITKAGARSDLSAPVTVTGMEPPVVARIPTTPSLTSSHGNVRAVWSGEYTSGGDVPGAHTIRVEARVGSGAWLVQGAALDKAGEQLVSIGDIGDTVQVRFLAYDQLQRLTGTSAVASIVVQGVAFTDFDTASQNYILGIESKADSAVKSTVVQFAKNTSATTAPTSGWSTTRPSRGAGEHVWTRTLITYNDGTTSTTTPFSSTGDQGKDGTDGISVTSVVRYYRLGTSKPAQPTGSSPSGWSTTEPGYMEGQKLYYAERVLYSNNTVSWSLVQESSAYAAAAQANAKADVLAAGQTVLGRSVDGLNRRFTSLDAPKRGVFRQSSGSVEMFENLAPPTVGSGTWVGVGRNYFTADPGRRGTNVVGLSPWVGSGSSSSGNASVPWSKSGRATWTTLTGRTGTAGNIGPTPNYLNSARSAGDGTVTFELTINLSHSVVMTAPTLVGGVELVDSVGAISIPAQTPTRLWITVRKPSGPFLSSDQIRFNHRLPAGDAWFDVADLDAYPGPFQPNREWFDGAYNPDPDMRTRWLGEPNASESVMEGERVAGWSGVNGTHPIISTKLGETAMRVIRTTEANSYVSFTRSSSLGDGVMTTQWDVLREDEALVMGSGNSYAEVSNPWRSIGAQGDAQLADVGVWARVSLSGDTSSWTQSRHLYLRPPNTVGDSLFYKRIGLYAGTLPDDAIPFHNGDEWHQLGWKPGETEDDPDRLVIEHIWTWNGQDWVHYDIWAENIFAAGSVTAREINFTEAFGEKLELSEALVGRINVNHLAPGFGETINISGNLKVIGLESQMTEAQDTATDATTSAKAAATAAALADSKAQAAQSAAESVSENLTEHKKAFTVTDGVPEVSTLDGEYKLRLDANRITMYHSSQPVTYWEDSKFVVREIDIIQGMLANHWIESVGDHGTVFKPRNE